MTVSKKAVYVLFYIIKSANFIVDGCSDDILVESGKKYL